MKLILKFVLLCSTFAYNGFVYSDTNQPESNTSSATASGLFDWSLFDALLNQQC